MSNDEVHDTDLVETTGDDDVTDLDDEQLGRAARLIADDNDGALIFNFEGRRFLRRLDV